MFLMPFQILGMWLRGVLAIAFLGLGIYLVDEWYSHRQSYITEERTVVESNGAPAKKPDGSATPQPENGSRQRTEQVVHVVDWQFGFNRETAYLLGGVAALCFTLGGGFLPMYLLRRRGGEKLAGHRDGSRHSLKRPDGSELEVEMYGPEDGPPVIMTHGWGLDSEEWFYAKQNLGNQYRLIVWDLPGLGRSKGPANKDWSLEKLARDLEAVLAFVGGRPAVLVGHSIGGMIILTFCKLFPEALGSRVCGLAIVQSTYTNPVKTTSKPWLYTPLQKPLLEPLCHLMIWLAPLVWLMNWMSYLNGSAHRSTDRQSFSGNETWEQLDFMARYTVCAWPAVVARGMLGMFQYDATATLATIPVPTLVVAGDKDALCSPEASEFMSHSIPGATLRIFDQARHCGVFEHHAKFHGWMHEFLRTCTAASAPVGSISGH